VSFRLYQYDINLLAPRMWGCLRGVGRRLNRMKLRPFLVMLTVGALLGALFRKRVAATRPVDPWEPVSYS
jgi:hypothetical protein